jgi:ADP-ribose pyrophosphatase YjhB (NUDIX family)
MAQAFTIGAFGIIRDDKNRILLCLRNDYDLRNLPGGGVEDGESPREAVIREVKEETGLNVEILRLIGIYDKPTTNDIVFSFECKKIGGKLTLNEESKDIRYFPRSEIPHNT